MRQLLFFLITLQLINVYPQNRTDNADRATIVLVDKGGSGKAAIFGYKSPEQMVRYDTIFFKNSDKISWSRHLSHPQYVQLIKNGRLKKVFLSPGAKLTITTPPALPYVEYKGKDAKANQYLDAISQNEELNSYFFSTSRKTDIESLKQQLHSYLAKKKEILDMHFPSPKDQNSNFYQLQLHDFSSFKQYILAKNIKENYPDSIYNKELSTIIGEEFELPDEEMLNVESKYARYMSQEILADYFGMKKYGHKWKEVEQQEGRHSFLMRMAHEFYPPTLAKVIVRDELNYLVDQVALKLVREVGTKSPQNHDLAYSMLNQYGFILPATELDSLKSILAEHFQETPPTYAEKITDFSFENIAGEEISLNSPSNKFTLVSVWTSWCKPCIANFGKVHETQQTYESQLEVISISLDRNREDFLGIIEKFNVPGSLRLWAVDGFYSSFALAFQITSVPKYLLVDKSGKVIAIDYWGNIVERIQKIK